MANLLHVTWNVNIVKHPAYQDDKPYLFAFWHGKQLLPVLQLVKHNTPKAALVSPSQDGDLLETWLQQLGYEVIRGSSRTNNIRSTINLIRKLRTGFSIGFGIDGPIGPRYQAKPGMLYLAQKCQIPIVPLASTCINKWILTKAWDHYQIPKPFAKIGYYIGKPIMISKNTDLEQARITLGFKMHEAQLKATQALVK